MHTLLLGGHDVDTEVREHRFYVGISTGLRRDGEEKDGRREGETDDGRRPEMADHVGYKGEMANRPLLLSSYAS